MTEWHNRYGGARGDDLLAGRATLQVHLLATEIVLVSGSGGDDRGAAAALHRHRDLGRGRGQGQLRRYPRGQRGRLRVNRTARVPAIAAAEKPRRDPPVPARRHRRLRPERRRCSGWPVGQVLQRRLPDSSARRAATGQHRRPQLDDPVTPRTIHCELGPTQQRWLLEPTPTSDGPAGAPAVSRWDGGAEVGESRRLSRRGADGGNGRLGRYDARSCPIAGPCNPAGFCPVGSMST